MRLKLPGAVIHILNELEKNGYSAYAVGGCVRDMLLNMQPHDYDICTSALPEQVAKCFEKVIKTGIKHGTVTVLIENKPVEVTTFRTEGSYSDNRRPDSVVFVSNIKDDLSRRDFTINVMAYSEAEGVVDYYNGKEDLDNRIIRAVGNPNERFSEDALRILRALRFSSTYGFLMEEQTKNAVFKLADNLKNISAERVRVEIEKLIMGDDVKTVLLEYADVIGVVLPEILCMVGFLQNNPYHKYDVYEHTVNAVAKSKKDVIIRMALFLHDIGKPHCYTQSEDGIGHFYGHGKISAQIAKVILGRLRFDNKSKSEITELVLLHDAKVLSNKKSVVRWLNKIGEEQLKRLIHVKIADAKAQSGLELEKRLQIYEEVLQMIEKVKKENSCFNMKMLAVDGQDIIKLGVCEGKNIGIVLNTLLEAVLDERVANDKEALLDYAKTSVTLDPFRHIM